jgi:hypothetical protein
VVIVGVGRGSRGGGGWAAWVVVARVEAVLATVVRVAGPDGGGDRAGRQGVGRRAPAASEAGVGRRDDGGRGGTVAGRRVSCGAWGGASPGGGGGRRAPAAAAAGMERRDGGGQGGAVAGRHVAGGAWGGAVIGRRVTDGEAAAGEARLGETTGRRRRVSVVSESERGGEGCGRLSVASLPSARDLALGKEFFF